jgi:hypothetical protein
MNRVALLSFAVLLTLSSLASAAPVTVLSYSFDASPSNGWYPDSSGVELIDGVKGSVSFGSGMANASTVEPFVAWYQHSPTITFNFAPNTAISSVTLTIDDGNGAAGVIFPNAVTISYGVTNLTTPLTDPAGYGILDVNFSTGNFVGSSLNIIVSNPAWFFVSEVAFDYTPAIPTPAALPAGLALLSLLGLRRRR